MGERIDRRSSGYAPDAHISPKEEELLLRELELIRMLQPKYARIQSVDVSELYEDERRNDEPETRHFEDEDQEVQIPIAPKPSEWGASVLVDTPETDDYYAMFTKKDRLKIPRKEIVIGIGIVSVWSGIALGNAYSEQIEDPYSMMASLPVVGKSDPAKKELLDKLLTNCTDENVGDVLSTGNISAESSIIWNVPNADGTLSPLLPARLDPESEIESQPRTVIESSVLTIGACDTGGQPAISIHDTTVKVDFSRTQSRIMIQGEKVYADGLPKSLFDESVKVGIIPQETADVLIAETTSPANVDIAVNNTLRDVGAIITAKDSVYENQVETVSRAQIIAKVLAELAVKSPGVTYRVEAINELPDTSVVGLEEIMTDKFAVTGSEVTSAKIAADPDAVKS